MLDDEILTAEEVARYLNLSVATVYRLAKEGEIPAKRIGQSWRFRSDLLDDWLNERNKVPPQRQGRG